MGENAAGAAFRILAGFSFGIRQNGLAKASETRTNALYHESGASSLTDPRPAGEGRHPMRSWRPTA
jgi:hypothetical protein